MAWAYGKFFYLIEGFIDYFEENNKSKHPEIHMHHTYIPSHKDFNHKNHRRLQDGMKNYHINTRKFQDIAQHLTIYPDGTCMTGRDCNVPPASIVGRNDSDLDSTHPFMFEMVGNFDKGHDRLEGKQLDAVVKLVRYFGNHGSELVFHNQYDKKTCPGTSIEYDWIMGQVKAMPRVKTMYDLYYLEDDGTMNNTISSAHFDTLSPEIERLVDARANYIVIKKRGFDPPTSVDI